MVADCAAKHGIAGFQSIQNGPLRHRTGDFQRHLAAVKLGESPEMRGQHDAHLFSIIRAGRAHGRVCTSTDRTAGRCSAIGVQLSPASLEAYTCPPVVPKYTPHLSSESTAIASRRTFTKQLLCGRPFVNSSHSLPPVLLR